MEEGQTMKLLNFLSAFSIFCHVAQAGTPTKVRIDFIETLAPKDTTSSVRFEKDYRGAIQLGQALVESKLAKCGYSLETKTALYEASDALKAKELGSQSDKDGAWLIVGPRRSNHYLLLVQGANDTPTVSLMASADQILTFGPRHVSVSPSNSQMARIAAEEAKAQKGAKATYVTVVSDDCTNCVDFSKAFDVAAGDIGLKKLDAIKITGEEPDLEAIKTSVLSKKPKFVLLPNYSNVSSKIMGAFNRTRNTPLFVGGDGWGDSRYGFVEHGQQVENIRGITIRGFPPVENQLKLFSAGRTVLQDKRLSLFQLRIPPSLKLWIRSRRYFAQVARLRRVLLFKLLISRLRLSFGLPGARAFTT